MKRRITCLCLAVLMLCGALAGCGSKNKTTYTDDENEQVTLTMALPAAKQEDADKVLEEVNKRLETLLPNTKLELIYGDLEEKWPLWMATKKSIDIAHSGFATDLEEEVKKKSYLELDTLIDEYAPTIKKHQEIYWYAYDTGVIDGNLYAVPNTQIYTKEIVSFEMAVGDVSIAEYMDLEALVEEAYASDKTTEKFWQLVDEGIEKAVAAGVNLTGALGTSWYGAAKKGYNFIGGKNSNLCYDNGEDVQIIDFYTTDEFKTYCTYMKKWADKGYVSPDILTGKIQDMVTRPVSMYYFDKETGLPKNGEPGAFLMENPDKVKLLTDIGSQGTYWSIPFTSEHPVRAIKFLDLLHSEEGAEIVNLLAYGFEGEHYEFVDKENGDINAFEYDGQGGSSVSYGIANWTVSNMLTGMYQVDPYTHELKDYAKDYYLNKVNTLDKHPLYGCNFDLSVVSGKMSNILKNNVELAPNIYSGVLSETETMLEELMSKNKTAGIEDVIKELQKQADEYIASQK